MAQKKLSRVKGLSGDFTSRLAQKGISTCRGFLTRSPLEIMDILDVSYPRVQVLTSLISQACAPTSKTVLSMYTSSSGVGEGQGFLSTSIPSLDSLLKGGLPPATITEVSGPPGCGKTQFCTMLSVHCALPPAVGGRGTPVIYIDTEGAFSAERLVEMGKCHIQLPDFESRSVDTFLLRMARNVHIYQVMTIQSFLECLGGLDTAVASTGAGLVVVDSIASLVRKEFDVSSSRGAIDRTALLLKQSASLKFIAETFKIPVVVTNQIVTQLSDPGKQEIDGGGSVLDGGGAGGHEEDGGVVTLALGNAWYHSVNTRVLLKHRRGRLRELSVVKSPVCGRCSIFVTVGKLGLTAAAHQTDEINMSKETSPTTAGFPLEFPGQQLL